MCRQGRKAKQWQEFKRRTDYDNLFQSNYELLHELFSYVTLAHGGTKLPVSNLARSLLSCSSIGAKQAVNSSTEDTFGKATASARSDDSGDGCSGLDCSACAPMMTSARPRSFSKGEGSSRC